MTNQPTNVPAKLAEIQALVVRPESQTTQVCAFLVIGTDGHSIHVYGASADEYQKQGDSIAPVHVEHFQSSDPRTAKTAEIVVRSFDGETVDELIARVIDFVTTETPVPA
ncbi:hypothetical protein [Gordonia sp. SND2]|uniref:hypothetical protein n=1 Tax=Gordonia sp. SND2 TaxID=3388659 RepID=UPI00398B94FA